MSLFFIYFEGLFVSLSLVAAIGLQNAFVLEQSIKKNHVYLIVALCIFLTLVFFGLVLMALISSDKVCPICFIFCGGLVLVFSFFTECVHFSFLCDLDLRV